jgi:hypothetical protein
MEIYLYHIRKREHNYLKKKLFWFFFLLLLLLSGKLERERNKFLGFFRAWFSAEINKRYVNEIIWNNRTKIFLSNKEDTYIVICVFAGEE